jgi:ribose 5-phosphate isomerase B
MKVVLANDHGAVELAQRLKAHLEGKGITVNHLGVFTEESVDYPDIAKKAADEYKKGGYDFGIVCCGTGEGISMAANKIQGIRCALPVNAFAAEKAREHNNANFLAFGGRITNYPDSPEAMVDAYMAATFAGGRHQKRIDKLTALESTR